MPAVQKASILVADPNEDKRDLKVRLLRAAGFDVKEARSGADALKLVELESPQVLLLEAQLADANGIEICRRIKSSPATSSTLILFTSSSPVESGEAIAASEAGADCYLAGPARERELLPRVHLLLRAWHAEHVLRQGELRIRQLMENAPDVMYRYRFSPSASFDYVSPAAKTITGYTPEELYADPELFLRMIHPDDRSKLDRFLRDKSLSGRPLLLRWIHKDGRMIWLEQRNAPIHDRTGALVGLEGIARDATESKRTEEVHQELAAIVESCGDAIIGTALDGTIQTWNEGAERLYGYSAEDAQGRSVSILIPPERSQELDQILGILKRGERIPRYETVRVTKEGRRILVSLTISPIRDPSGMISAVSAIARDISEQRRTEGALRESEEQLAAIIGSAMDAIITVDADQRITLFNAAAEKAFRCSAAEALGQPIERFIPDRFRDLHRKHFIQFSRTKVTKRTMGRLGAISGLRMDGEEFPIEASISQVEVGGQKLYTVILRDITERKRVEEERDQLLFREQASRKEAEDAQHRLELLAEASAALSTSLDYKATLKKIAQLALPKFADWCAVDLMHEDGTIHRVAAAHADPAKHDLMSLSTASPQYHWSPPLAVMRALTSGESELVPEVSELWNTAQVYDPAHLKILQALNASSYIVVPLAARDRVFGAISFVLSNRSRRYTQADLTLAKDLGHRCALAIDNARLYEAEHKARAEAEAASRIKDEFLATLSHELRTPINAMLGWARMLRRGKLDEPTMTRAQEIIERNAQAQAKLVDDILDISRIITGKFRLDVRRIHLVHVIEAAIDTVRPAASAKGIRIESALDPDAGPILGDPDRLQQLVWNLLSNAVKFTPPEGRIRIQLERKLSSVTVVVSDTGEGISPEFLPHVFDPLRQADGTTARSHGGLGLGLGLVRHLAEQHGGTVRADSPGKGKGSTFTVELPLIAREDKERRDAQFMSEEEVSEEERLMLRGLRLLVVDDESDSLELLTTWLGKSGAQVTQASSCAEALEAFGRSCPDLLVADIGMPIEDGYSLIAKVRRMKQGGSIPAIALTGYASIEDSVRAIRAGYQIHVPKPVDLARLTRLIANLTGRVGKPTSGDIAR